MLSYSPGPSIVHSVDARVKILWLIAILTFMFSTRSFETAVFSLLLTVLFCALASISPHRLFPRPKFVLFLIAIPLILGAVFISPSAGLVNSALLFSALSLSILFIMTTEQRAIVSALHSFKVPASTSFSLALSLGFLPVFERKFSSVRVAQSSRGHSSNNPVPLIVPFMHSVMRKAKNLSLSMDSRAFNPDRAPLFYRLRMRSLDWFALFTLLVLLLAKLLL